MDDGCKGAQGSLWNRVASVMVALMFVGTALSALALAVPAVSAVDPIDVMEAGAPAAEPLAYVDSAPIRVNDSTELAAAADSGNGTMDDPYVISGKRIDAQGGEYGIHIGNITDKYLIIEDCYVSNVSGSVVIGFVSGTGILLYRIGLSSPSSLSETSVIVRNCTVEQCVYGIKLIDSDRCLIVDNDVSDISHMGVAIYGNSNDNRVVENSIHDVDNYGIDIYGADENIVLRNDIYQCRNGIYLYSADHNEVYGNTVSDCTSHGLRMEWHSSNNTVAANSLYRNNGADSTYNVSHLQALDNGADNNWTYFFDGYYHGNYWDDLGSAISVNGTHTTAYDIDGDANETDPYPSMIPVNSVPFVFGYDPEFEAWSLGMGGNGSESLPYVMDGLIVNAQGCSAGIVVYDLDDIAVTIDGCEAYYAQDHDGTYGGSGFYINHTNTPLSPYSVTVMDCVAMNNTIGLNLEQGNNTIIMDSVFDHNQAMGVRINNTIWSFMYDCECDANGGRYGPVNPYWENWGMHVMDSHFVFVEDSTFSYNVGARLGGISYTYGIEVEDCYAIVFDNVTCSFNRATSDSTAYSAGISIETSETTFIEGSSFCGNTAYSDGSTAYVYGIELVSVEDISISDSEMDDNWAADTTQSNVYGLKTQRVYSITIDNCSMSYNTASSNARSYVWGAYLSEGLGADIIDSTIEGNDADSGSSTNVAYGIKTFAQDYTNITHCTISYNNASTSSYGIMFDSMFWGDHGNVTYNVIEGHRGVAVFTTGSDFTFFGNSFIDNNGATSTYDPWHVQVYDGGTNDWNSTTQSFGNYWSDWTSPDANHDMIVDDPYVISTSDGIQDDYPLTEPSVHPKIRIDSDAELADFIAEEGLPGTGSEADPYVIEGFTITAGGTGAAIYVGNTTDYLIIRDNTLLNSDQNGIYDYAALTLYSVESITVTDNEIRDSTHGIYGFNVDLSTIESNVIHSIGSQAEGVENTGFGIYLQSSSIVDVDSNLIYDVDPLVCGGYSAYGRGIYITTSDHVSVECNDVFSVNGTTAHGIYIVTVSDFVVESNDVMGIGNESSTDSWGIKMYDCSSYSVMENDVSLSKYGIYDQESDNASINSNGIEDCWRHGAYIYRSDNITVFGNNFYDNNQPTANYSSTGIQAWQTAGTNINWSCDGMGNYWNTWTSPDVDGDFIVDSPYVLYAPDGRQDPYPSTIEFGSLYIEGDEELLEAAAEYGWSGTGAIGDPIVIEGLEYNAFFSPFCIRVTCVDLHTEISNNTIAYTNSSSMESYSGSQIAIFESANIVVTHNHLHFGIVAIRLVESVDLSASYNEIEDHTWCGVELWFTNATLVYGNDISSSGGSSRGIVLHWCDVDTITNNVIECGATGIQIDYESSNLLVMFNTMSNHLDYGAYITSSDNCTFVGNVFINNSGPGLGDSQAWDEGTDNSWNTTIGNYWSDWTSPDANKDDIVDEPYVIGGTSGFEDSLPLTNEVSRPYGLDGTVGDGCILVEWTASNYSLFSTPTYAVHRSVDNGTFELVESALTVTMFSDTNVSWGHVYTYYVVANNSRTDSNDSDVLVVDISDVDPPVVIITSPVNGTTLTSTDVNVTWGAWDNGTRIAYMNVSIDGGDWTTVDVMYHMFTDLSEDEHTVVVNVTDDAGLYTTDSVTFTVAIPPEVVITSPTNGSTILTADVNVTWDAWDNESGIASMQLSVDGGEWTTVNETHYVLIGLMNGDHSVVVNVTDNAGHHTMDSVTFTVAVPIGINITSPSNDEVFNVLYVNVTWEAWGNGSDVDHYEVMVDGGTYLNVGLNTSIGGIFLPGHHVVHVKVVDVNMNEANASVGFFTGPEPTVVITNPDEGSMLYLPNVTVAWGISAVDIASIDIQVDGGNWTSVPVNATSTTIDVEVGNHTVIVRVTDSCGRMGNSTVNFTTEDRPSVTILSPTDGARLNTDDVEVTWEGEAEYHGVDHYEVRIGMGEWLNVGLSTSHTFTGLVEGGHQVDVKVVCNYGNTATDSITFSVDTIAPEVTAHDPVGDTVLTTSTIVVTFSEPMDHETVEIVIAGVTGTVAWSGDTATFTPSAALAAGTSYTVTVNGDDLAGNALDEYVWTFDTGSGTATLTGTVQDSDGNGIAGVTVTSGSVSTTTSDNGTFTMELSPGDHTVTLTKDGYDDGSFDVTLEEGETDDVTETMTATASGGDNTMLYVIIAVVVIAAIGGAVFFLRKQGKL